MNYAILENTVLLKEDFSIEKIKNYIIEGLKKIKDFIVDFYKKIKDGVLNTISKLFKKVKDKVEDPSKITFRYDYIKYLKTLESIAKKASDFFHDNKFDEISKIKKEIDNVLDIEKFKKENKNFKENYKGYEESCKRVLKNLSMQVNILESQAKVAAYKEDKEKFLEFKKRMEILGTLTTILCKKLILASTYLAGDLKINKDNQNEKML